MTNGNNGDEKHLIQLAARIDAEFDRLFAEWLINNPSFAGKDSNFLELVREHFHYWFLQGVKNQSIRKLLKDQ